MSKIFDEQVGQVSQPAIVSSVAQAAAWESRPTSLLTSSSPKFLEAPIAPLLLTNETNSARM